jgi:superfamily II DNA/RNA helicase
LKKVKYLVIDEADRILGGNFDEQLERIFAELPEKRQNLLFSATMTDTLEKVREVAKNEVHKCLKISVQILHYETIQISNKRVNLLGVST